MEIKNYLLERNRTGALARWDTADWDEQTRKAVMERLTKIPEVRFFLPEEVELLTLLIDHILPQDDRDPTERIPILPFLDEKIHTKSSEGYRYSTMPSAEQAWRRGLRGIVQSMDSLYSPRSIRELKSEELDTLITLLYENKTPGDGWTDFPSSFFLEEYLMKNVIKIYYAHPAAWKEIDFSGPAAVRGHVRLKTNGRDPWENHQDEWRNSK